MMENASFFVAGVEGIDAVFTGHQHLVFPGKKDFQELEGVDPDKGTLHGKPAVMGGFWGSHMGLIDLLLEKRRRQLEDRLGAPPRRGRSTSASTTRPRRWSSDDQRIVDGAARPTTRRRSPMSAARSARPRRRSIPISRWSPTIRRCRSSARRRPGTSRTCSRTTEWKDLPLLSAAAPFKAGGRGGADYYTDVPAGDDRDQERRRPLPLSQHGAGGGDHRGAGQGMAGDVGRHLQPDRSRARPTRR